MSATLILSLVLVAYNNLINRWGPFHGAAYVPVNLAFTAAVTIPAVFVLSAASIGLQGDLGDLLLPVVLVAIFAIVMFGLASSRQAHRIADRRVAGTHGSALGFYVLVRIPFGTAVTEELIFRGVLFAAWQTAGASELAAAVAASVAFGLWHIAPTIIGLRMNDPDASVAKVRAAVIGAVLLTTAGGLGLTWLRVWSGGLLAPIVLHAGINSVGALAAVAAGRRSEARGPPPLDQVPIREVEPRAPGSRSE